MDVQWIVPLWRGHLPNEKKKIGVGPMGNASTWVWMVTRCTPVALMEALRCNQKRQLLLRSAEPWSCRPLPWPPQPQSMAKRRAFSSGCRRIGKEAEERRGKEGRVGGTVQRRQRTDSPALITFNECQALRHQPPPRPPPHSQPRQHKPSILGLALGTGLRPANKARWMRRRAGRGEGRVKAGAREGGREGMAIRKRKVKSPPAKRLSSAKPWVIPYERRA